MNPLMHRESAGSSKVEMRLCPSTRSVLHLRSCDVQDILGEAR